MNRATKRSNLFLILSAVAPLLIRANFPLEIRKTKIPLPLLSQIANRPDIYIRDGIVLPLSIRMVAILTQY